MGENAYPVLFRYKKKDELEMFGLLKMSRSKAIDCAKSLLMEIRQSHPRADVFFEGKRLRFTANSVEESS